MIGLFNLDNLCLIAFWEMLSVENSLIRTDDEKDRLTSNIVAGLKNVSRVDIIERQLKHFYLADKDYGERIEMKLKELKVL